MESTFRIWMNALLVAEMGRLKMRWFCLVKADSLTCALLATILLLRNLSVGEAVRFETGLSAYVSVIPCTDSRIVQSNRWSSAKRHNRRGSLSTP